MTMSHLQKIYELKNQLRESLSSPSVTSAMQLGSTNHPGKVVTSERV